MSLQLITTDAKVITAQANEAISAGQFVKGQANNTDKVSAGTLSTFVSSDIGVEKVDAANDDQACIGIAGATAASGDVMPVYTEGLFIVRSAGSISVGALVKASTADSSEVAQISTINNNDEELTIIGRSLTGATAADNGVIVKLRA